MSPTDKQLYRVSGGAAIPQMNITLNKNDASKNFNIVSYINENINKNIKIRLFYLMFQWIKRVLILTTINSF